MVKDDKNPKLAGHQLGFEAWAPLARTNRRYQITWDFELLVGASLGGVSKDFCDDLVRQCTGSAPHTVKAPMSLGRD